MPIYEYRCAKGHAFEVFQSMSEDPVERCVECGAAAERVLSAPAVHFKGSGFYTTDYARKGAKRASGDGGAEKAGSGSESGGSGDSGSGSGDGGEKKGSSAPAKGSGD
jgi:putative FmdB family regulatory protein